jgi:hypothetical protein
MYTKNWSVAHPGCFIVLIDQSGSMSDPFGRDPGKRKDETVAELTNRFLEDFIKLNVAFSNSGEAHVRPRADIAVLGYGHDTVRSAFTGPLAGKSMISLMELDAAPLEIRQRQVQDINTQGKAATATVDYPIWILPKASGNTPMIKAFGEVEDLARRWARSHQDSYPPVVMHITDGKATDTTRPGDVQNAAHRLTSIATRDGSVLLFTVHITDQDALPVEYPATPADGLPMDDPYAQLLFEISSIIPETAQAALYDLLGRTVPPGARGLIFNGDPTSVALTFNFASNPAVPILDPTR